MSDFTFNIADYRPLSAPGLHRVQDPRSTVKRARGFVVLTPNSDSTEYEAKWQEARPEVVDIRSVRESHRTGHLLSYPRRAKVLRFSSDVRECAHTTPAYEKRAQFDDDPDPVAA